MLTHAPASKPRSFKRPLLIALVFAVTASDILLFDQQDGLNVFLWFLTVGLCLLLAARRGLRKETLILALVVLGAIAPLIETPSWQAISVAAVGLLLLSLSTSDLLPNAPSAIPAVAARVLLKVPARFLRGIGRVTLPRPDSVYRNGFGRELRLWIMPLIFTLIFVLLFASANPLIEKALASISLDALLALFDTERILFWSMMAGPIWILLRPRLARCCRKKQNAAEGQAQSRLFNEPSLLRALILFNLLFAVQTVLDVTYLWGGVELPEGMSHAEYAHRGSHPLIVTALLAGLFVLLALRQDASGPRADLIRRLVYLWIAQNILLCLSAILRLDLYVEAFSLTRMRVAAGLWMLLVAVGLGLIILKIFLRKTNAWLLATNAASLLVLFYAIAITDIPAYIASYNLTHAREVDGNGEPLDIDYLTSLGPTALPAIDAYLDTPGAEFRDLILFARLKQQRRYLLSRFDRRPQDLRNWTWRMHRLEKYLAARTSVE